jgi:hypothetical protein
MFDGVQQSKVILCVIEHGLFRRGLSQIVTPINEQGKGRFPPRNRPLPARGALPSVAERARSHFFPSQFLPDRRLSKGNPTATL